MVVNVSRGGLLDGQALALAITSGHLAGAGIDVRKAFLDVSAVLSGEQPRYPVN